MAASSTPSTRQPSASLTLNGATVPGTVISLEVTNNNYFSPDSFRVEMALSAMPDAYNAAFWADSQAQIGLSVGLGPGVQTQLILGLADEIELDLPHGCVRATGRDLSAPFLDNKTEEKFQNQTSSQIVEVLAARHGLTTSVTATTTPVGKYYEIDHARLTSDVSEWTLLNYLAQEEGFDIWVSGSVLNFQPSAQGSDPAYTIQYTPPTATSVRAGNFTDLTCRRSQTLARGTVVKVVSWNAKQQTAFTATAKRSGKGAGSNPQIYTFKVPGLDQSQAQALANAKLSDITRHERVIDVTMPGDLSLQPRQLVGLAGTGTAFDQTYFVDEISRRLSVDEGFIQTIRMKNHSPDSTVSI